MRQSQLLANTLREAPAEAEVASHRLLLRAGYIRQLAAGIYTYLPLGLRVLRNVERVLREEMDRAGAQELLMPALQPAELWQESGRYNAYGPELIRLADRHQREFVLGPTHEEVITKLMKNEINSYRKLPVTLYQIQTKFRDERRPRSGLLRGREFLMKDAYSFDISWEGLDQSYQAMFGAYQRIFDRCGLNFRAVEADAGSIGGEGSTHEFMALADIGEDTIAVCSQCGYAANLEKASSVVNQVGSGSNVDRPMSEKIHTPGVHTIEHLAQYLHIRPRDIMKTLIYLADGNPIAVLVRGDYEINEIKVKNALGVDTLELADAETTAAVTQASVGFAGPIGLSIPLHIDETIISMEWGVAGANESEFHLRHVVPGRDFIVARVGDFHIVKEGEVCARCETGKLRFVQGIEVGHVFKLGTKYSEALGARYLDANGSEQLMIMGCYGIGVSRLVSAVVEQHCDERGMVWPTAIAPYQVHLIPISSKDTTQTKLANDMYDAFKQRGVEVLLDDREERAGVKFNDSDLIGLPVRIVVGKDAVHGKVEYVDRRSNEKQLLSLDEALSRISASTL
ncbi:proline--tRNA ligase [Paenibacillus sp. 598K]|uniref:proline--tRNA ligase n=1 Tax=Paenibacillus sp. 598K TaxID=1117987 RepID=UPI000FFA5D07|nr:proline--tRNA ligase [Paenibacillus sp. 598K]GBF78104.1 proline--tRNA ligase [Paenibacillus sp. 598K]